MAKATEVCVSCGDPVRINRLDAGDVAVCECCRHDQEQKEMEWMVLRSASTKGEK
jgi:RNA polymerase-binding transcription factor DksA